jgi:hypothetical protein
MQNLQKKVTFDENQLNKENTKPKSEKKVWRTPLQDITNTFNLGNQASPNRPAAHPSVIFADSYIFQLNKPASKSAFKQLR